jgi:DNA recombination protein RmuC
MVENAKAEAQTTALQERLASAQHDYGQLKETQDATLKLLFEAQKNLELKVQSMHEFEKRVSDWESSRQEALTQTKAAIFETASKLSEQLLEQHTVKTQEAEVRVGKAAQELQNQFESVVKSVAVLHSEIKSSKDTVEYVKTALLSPTGAGNLSEITLENLLKASGLEHERDFFMQYSFNIKGIDNKERLRPDAIVLLPNNNLLVIDSKASKYFLELGDKSDEQRKQLEQRLKNSMYTHLRSLHSKGYKDFLLEHFKDKNHISSVMFLPSEACVERLSSVCREFMLQAWAKDIFPMGPAGLINVLAYAKFQIAAVRQSENQRLILEEVRKLLGSLQNMHEHTRKVGYSIYAACGHFDKLAASFNANLLPKARALEKLGLSLPKAKAMPGDLDRLKFIGATKMELLPSCDDQV